MRILLLAAFVLTACGQGSAAKPQTIDPGDFLRKAVTEGLKEDGADRAFVKACIADRSSLFVLKCPICEPVRMGFSEYGSSRSGEKPLAPAEGKGIPKDIVDGLKDPARPAGLKGIERLVDRYVSRHYERLGMSADDRKKMQAALEERKKEGMKMKELGPQKDFGDFCPSCNGAAKAK
jgi:hypothetical protein